VTCIRIGVLTALAVAGSLVGAGPENVLLVINQSSGISKQIGDYYARRRSIPATNVCRIEAPETEVISRQAYEDRVAAPIAQCLRSKGLTETILYIVTTLGVPLRIDGAGASLQTDIAAVDSELTMLYGDLHGRSHPLKGPAPNPFFAQRDAPFVHSAYPIYLVTRLAGYDLNDVKGLIDRSIGAVNRGKVVLDLPTDQDTMGNDWLRDAAILLPKERVLVDESKEVLYNQKDVIGYASWGSNDAGRKQRMLGFQWLPGAIMTEYVSTNARTFERPPADWNLSTWDLKDRLRWFAGSPQSMIADYIHEGVTGAAGHVFEPYLQYTPRPQHLFPAYLSGRNLAESYYLSIPAVSWMNIVVGDPLCKLPVAR
jgi:uncharacterized protein (TIGR03790 family)